MRKTKLFSKMTKAASVGLFFACLIVHIASAQTSTLATPPDQSSALDMLPKHCHFSSKFTQEKTLSSLPVPLISLGKMYFSCQAGLIWETQEPIQESVILTRSDYHFKQIGHSNKPAQTELELLDSIETRFLSRLLIGLMSADKAYINNTFTVFSVSENAFELSPKDNFISKAIKTVNIQKEDQDVLNIAIDQKDGTQINIRSHSATILDGAGSHMTICLKEYPENAYCQALFEPLKVVSQLNDNAGS